MKNASKKRLRRHQRNNARLASEWKRYTAHRARVTTLLQTQLEDGARRIALLGAGNGNDVELHALIADHEVHLFDLDALALARAKERVPAVHTHAAELASPRPGWAEDAAQDLQKRMGGAADLVVSLGLLSQVVWALADASGGLRGSAQTQAQAAVLAHLDLASRLGSKRLFIVDTAPYGVHAAEFDRLHEDDQLRALAVVEGQGSAIPFTSPGFLVNARQTTGHNPVLHAPWIWNVAPTRPFLTYALSDEA